MNDIKTLTITKIIPVSNALKKNGIDINEILTSLNINPDIMSSPDNRISAVQLHKILNKAVLATGNESFGLSAGEIFNGLSNILGFVLINCRNIDEAIEKYCSYQKIYDETCHLEFNVYDDLALLKIKFINEVFDLDRQMADFRIAGILKYFKVLSGKNIKLKEAHFRHAAPGDLSEYNRIFGCPLKFNSDINGIVFNKLLVEYPTLQPNNNLLLIFEQLSRKIIEKNSKHDSYTYNVKRIIIKSLDGNAPTIEEVSKTLQIGMRSLQSKLKAEKTTFSKILDQVRRDIAFEYLKDINITISEISYLLGFSEPSVFHRCFKRWSSHTPKSYRELTFIGQEQ